jgi:hypothetical protein
MCRLRFPGWQIYCRLLKDLRKQAARVMVHQKPQCLRLYAQVATVLGYLAEAAAAAGALPGGCPQQLLQRLQQEAELAGSASAEVAMWRIAGALHSQRAAGLSGLKRLLPDDSYGQIKVGFESFMLYFNTIRSVERDLESIWS